MIMITVMLYIKTYNNDTNNNNKKKNTSGLTQAETRLLQLLCDNTTSDKHILIVNR